MPNCFLQVSNLGFLLKDFCTSLIQSVSATAMSWVVDSSRDRASLFSNNFMILTNVRMRAVTLSSLCKLLKSSDLIICTMPMGSAAASNKDEVSLWRFPFSSALTIARHSSGTCTLSNSSSLVSVKLLRLKEHPLGSPFRYNVATRLLVRGS